MDLTPIERRIFTNQYRILAAVAPDEALDCRYERLIKILESGFEGEYGQILGRVTENRLSAEDCHLVQDTLVMCSTPLDLQGQSNADVAEFEHVGFDSEHEHQHLSFARFLYDRDPTGYSGIKGVVGIHGRTVPRYREMVKARQQSPRSNQLSEGDMARILAAGANL